MMDEETLTVGYRAWRGEPRGKHRKAEGIDELGDCIDCMACVNVCPMGIDIRDGQQLACITCALCIDACDDVMHKIGEPRGLIDYMALSDEVRERNGEAPRTTWSHIFRTRTVLYTALWALVGVGLIVALFVRLNIEFTVAPVRNPIFVTLSDGSIRNTYDIRLRNKIPEERMFEISLTGNLAFGLSLDDTPYASVSVPADSTLLQRVFVTAPSGSDPATAEFTDLRFWIEDLTNGDRAFKDTTFNGDDR